MRMPSDDDAEVTEATSLLKSPSSSSAASKVEGSASSLFAPGGQAVQGTAWGRRRRLPRSGPADGGGHATATLSSSSSSFSLPPSPALPPGTGGSHGHSVPLDRMSLWLYYSSQFYFLVGCLLNDYVVLASYCACARVRVFLRAIQFRFGPAPRTGAPTADMTAHRRPTPECVARLRTAVGCLVATHFHCRMAALLSHCHAAGLLLCVYDFAGSVSRRQTPPSGWEPRTTCHRLAPTASPWPR